MYLSTAFRIDLLSYTLLNTPDVLQTPFFIDNNRRTLSSRRIRDKFEFSNINARRYDYRGAIVRPVPMRPHPPGIFAANLAYYFVLRRSSIDSIPQGEHKNENTNNVYMFILNVYKHERLLGRSKSSNDSLILNQRSRESDYRRQEIPNNILTFVYSKGVNKWIVAIVGVASLKQLMESCVIHVTEIHQVNQYTEALPLSKTKNDIEVDDLVNCIISSESPSLVNFTLTNGVLIGHKEYCKYGNNIKNADLSNCCSIESISANRIRPDRVSVSLLLKLDLGRRSYLGNANWSNTIVRSRYTPSSGILLFINNKKEVIIMAKTADGKKKVYVRHPTTPHYRSTPNKKGN